MGLPGVMAVAGGHHQAVEHQLAGRVAADGDLAAEQDRGAGAFGRADLQGGPLRQVDAETAGDRLRVVAGDFDRDLTGVRQLADRVGNGVRQRRVAGHADSVREGEDPRGVIDREAIRPRVVTAPHVGVEPVVIAGIQLRRRRVGAQRWQCDATKLRVDGDGIVAGCGSFAQVPGAPGPERSRSATLISTGIDHAAALGAQEEQRPAP